VSAGRVLERLGEEALLLRLGSEIDLDTNARVHALAARIRATRPAWLRDLVPAYASLALFVDPAAFADDADPLAAAMGWLDRLESGVPIPAADTAPVVEIPVRYGGADGPDLEAVARHAGISVVEVVERHCAATYTVAMLGFAPGFPYLLGLDARLATPRLPVPRVRVPAGSVGIGGAQTGVYPRCGPGGWRLIGRTEMPLFNADRDPPAALAPGDHVRFIVADAHAGRAGA
jgi:KipI family sensor histidine kinase inhibitor